MSAYGGPQTHDVERDELDYCGMRDHTGDGDDWASQPTEKCTRQAPPQVGGQSNRGPCPGRMMNTDPPLCDWCGRPKRGVR